METLSNDRNTRKKTLGKSVSLKFYPKYFAKSVSGIKIINVLYIQSYCWYFSSKDLANDRKKCL